MAITIPGCSFDFHSLDWKLAGAFASSSGEKTFIRVSAGGHTRVHLAQSIQIVGSHSGSSSAMSRRSHWDVASGNAPSTGSAETVSYTHLRAHETRHDLVCRLLLE